MDSISKPKLPSGIDFQGHRGCRGIMPENTIQGFIHALDLGVNTLEMDVVITKDAQVILSHEPWFSHEICTDPEGNAILEVEERTHAIFEMTYEQTQAYDCGLRAHPRFPEQKKLAAQKPLLREVLAASELHASNTGRQLPFYNIETKCTPTGDGVLHPLPDRFAQLLVDEVVAANVLNRTTIQSFDVRTLQYLEGKYPELRLALLVENGWTPQENIDTLGFTPHIYSPEYRLVTAELVAFCKENSMLLIPWTVNDAGDLESLLEMGVDGIISDFPDIFSPLLQKP